MVNAHTKGNAAENRFSTWLKVHGHENERLRLAGINDRGDIWVPAMRERLQVKNQANMLTAISQATLFCAQRHLVEGDQRWLGIIARPGMPPGRWYVVEEAYEH